MISIPYESSPVLSAIRSGHWFSRKVRLMYLWLCTLILWAHLVSVPPIPYKTWFIVTAIAAVVTVILAVVGLLRIRGVFGAVVPLGIYFLYFYVAGTWSQYPRDAHFYTLVDSVEVVIFAIFYVLVLNEEPQQIVDMMISIPYFSLAYMLVNLRLGMPGALGMAGTILPSTIPFIITAISLRRTQRRAVLALFCLVAALLQGQSRAPILASAVCAMLSLAFLRMRFGVKARIAVLGFVGFFGLIGALWPLPAARESIVRTYVRITSTSVHLAGIAVEAEGSDQVRQWLTEDFIREVLLYQPFGMGYQNFPYYYALYHGAEPVALHNIYEVWALEGGVCCVVIVVWMFGAHFISLVRCLWRAAEYQRRELARMVLIATIGVLVMGFFHQMHQVPITFALLGAGAALGRSRLLPWRLQRQRRRLTRPAVAIAPMQPVFERHADNG